MAATVKKVFILETLRMVVDNIGGGQRVQLQEEEVGVVWWIFSV